MNVPMPPKNSRSTCAVSSARITSCGVALSFSSAVSAFISSLSVISLAVRGNTPPPLRDQRRVVIGPRRAGQIEQAFALGPARVRIGLGIDEDVAMIEGREQLGLARQQHRVAEHVARHVADADDGERRRLGVAAHLAEMALHRFPRAARGDAHLLVVVAARTARGEGIAEPEAARFRECRWRCRRTSPFPCRRPRRDTDRRRRGEARGRAGSTRPSGPILSVRSSSAPTNVL